jgi:hypothetical protein
MGPMSTDLADGSQKLRDRASALAERYCPHPEAHAADPETSRLAADSVRDVAGTRRAVLALLKAKGPMMDEQIEQAWREADLPPATGQSLRSRRAELVRDGLVEFTGEKRRLASTGRLSQVWRVR